MSVKPAAVVPVVKEFYCANCLTWRPPELYGEKRRTYHKCKICMEKAHAVDKARRRGAAK